MRSRGLLLGICCLMLSLSANAHASRLVLQPKVLGFTADGNTFVYVERNGQSDHPNQEREAVCHDIRTAKVQRLSFLRGGENEPSPGQIAFQTWLKKNPAKCVGGPRSPDGKYALNVLLKSNARGRWAQQAYSVGASNYDSGVSLLWAKVRVLLAYQRQTIQIDKRDLRVEWRLEAGFIPCWSPDGQRLALVWYREGQGMRDEGEMSVQMIALSSELSWEFPPLRP